MKNCLRPQCWALLLAFAGNAHALSYSLDMSSLPSTQGWTYMALGNNATEAQVFSTVGGALHQDSSGVFQFAPGGNSYNIFNALAGGKDWTLSFSASLTLETNSAPFPNNHWGFAVAVFDPDGYSFGVGLGNNIVMTADNSEHNLDTSQIHEYRLEGKAGLGGIPGFELYVDNVFLASGLARVDGCAALGIWCNSISIGDSTSGPNGVGDYYSYSFTEIQPVPLPAAGWLFGSVLAGWAALGFTRRNE